MMYLARCPLLTMHGSIPCVKLQRIQRVNVAFSSIFAYMYDLPSQMICQFLLWNKPVLLVPQKSNQAGLN